MKKNLLVFLCFLVSILSFGQDQFKLAFYNVLNYPLEDNPPNRSQFLNVILSEMAPDIFMACELNSEDGARDILSVLKNTVSPSYQMAPFVLNTSDDNLNDQNDLQNIVYYDSDLFLLDDQTTISSEFRDFNRYRLKLRGSNPNNPIFLEVIVCHLKAQDGVDNENIRKDMIDDLQEFLETLPADSYVVLGGDFNVYRASEPAFVELLDASNNITFIDPAERVGNWHNNTTFLDVFTQSTRRTSGLGGASGGFDDRFDFIMTSENLRSGIDLSYVEDSYKVFGNNNNANCYNRDINSFNCSGDDYSFELRDALYNFSDHLPVSLLLQTNQTLSVDNLAIGPNIEIIGGNIISDRLRIRIDALTNDNQTLIIYNSLGQIIKSLTVKNSVYVEEVISTWANGLYFIANASTVSKPLKFIISN